MPLFRLSHKNLVNNITWEPQELGFSYLAYGLGSRFRWPDLLLSEFCEILTKLCPFFDFTIIAMGKPCQHDILRTAWTRILIFGIWLRINIKMTWLTFERILWNIDWVMPLFRLYHYSIVVGCKTRERLELGIWNFIKHVFFFFFQSALVWQSYAPFSSQT